MAQSVNPDDLPGFVLPSCQILRLWKSLWYKALPKFPKRSSHQLCELILQIHLTPFKILICANSPHTIQSLENKNTRFCWSSVVSCQVEPHFSAWDLSSDQQVVASVEKPCWKPCRARSHLMLHRKWRSQEFLNCLAGGGFSYDSNTPWKSSP